MHTYIIIIVIAALQYFSLLVDRTERRGSRQWLFSLGRIHCCQAKKKNREPNHRRSRKRRTQKHPKNKRNSKGKLRCGASPAAEVAGPPSEVSMAATPPLLLALFFLFRFFAMAARRALLVQVLGARVSRGFGGDLRGGRNCWKPEIHTTIWAGRREESGAFWWAVVTFHIWAKYNMNPSHLILFFSFSFVCCSFPKEIKSPAFSNQMYSTLQKKKKCTPLAMYSAWASLLYCNDKRLTSTKVLN